MNFELKSMFVLYDKVTRRGIAHRETTAEAKADFIAHITQEECEVFTDWVKNMQPQELDNFILANGFSIILIDMLEPVSGAVECKKIEPIYVNLKPVMVNGN